MREDGAADSARRPALRPDWFRARVVATDASARERARRRASPQSLHRDGASSCVPTRVPRVRFDRVSCAVQARATNPRNDPAPRRDQSAACRCGTGRSRVHPPVHRRPAQHIADRRPNSTMATGRNKRCKSPADWEGDLTRCDRRRSSAEIVDRVRVLPHSAAKMPGKTSMSRLVGLKSR